MAVLILLVRSQITINPVCLKKKNMPRGHVELYLSGVFLQSVVLSPDCCVVLLLFNPQL